MRLNSIDMTFISKGWEVQSPICKVVLKKNIKAMS